MNRRSSSPELVAAIARRRARAKGAPGAAQGRKRPAQAQLEREVRRLLERERAEGAEQIPSGLASRIRELRSILDDALSAEPASPFDSLRPDETNSLPSPSERIAPVARPTLASIDYDVKKPGWLSRLLPGADRRLMSWQHARRLELWKAQRAWEAAERARKAERLRLDDEARREAGVLAEVNAELELFRARYRSGEPEAVETYNAIVLDASPYPEGFPQSFQVAFLPEARELLVEYELPASDIVPEAPEHRLARSSEADELYSDVVASVALRTLHEIFQADEAGHVDVVGFNGFVRTTDPATAREVSPHLVSVRAAKQLFSEIALGQVDKIACLRSLGASVSPRPLAHQPVEPIVRFVRPPRPS
jgi:restriction system protein